MGTRSLTVFKESKGKEIVVLYRQFDGYPEGHGKDLCRFLRDTQIVHGFSGDQDKYRLGFVANGMSCLAAQVIAHFKDAVGGFYLHSAGTRGIGEEYIYTLSIKEMTLHLSIHEEEKPAPLVSGSIAEVSEWIYKRTE